MPLLVATAAALLTPAPPAAAADPPSRASAPALSATPPSVSLPRSARRFDARVPATTSQLVVVTAERRRTTYGVVRRYQRTASGWVLLDRWSARLGAGGLVKGTRRVQGTSTTPMGAYPVTETFGRRPDPGTRMPYRRVTDDDWWVQDRGSRYYNQRRLASQGGFRRSTTGWNSSEHLAAMGRQYDFVAVIDFNRPDPVIGRGSGIFLHVSKGEPTAGCVAIAKKGMKRTLRWLDPASHPYVVIGTRTWLRRIP